MDTGRRLLIIAQAMDQDDQVLGFFHRWVEEFAKHCSEIVVVCLKEGRHTLPSNVRVVSLGKERGRVSSLLYALRFYTALWRERKQYDDVFVHMNVEYVLLAGLLWRLLGKYVVLWYAHGSVTLRLRLAVLFASKVVTSSASGMRLVSKKRVIVGQGIDTEQFSKGVREESNAIRIVTIGRISKRKQLEDVIPALDLLYDRGVAFTYTIAGNPITQDDMAYEQKLRTSVEERMYADAVFFAGSVPHHEIPQVLRRSDVFVNLSQTGSMDKVVLEALACEVPVISTNLAFKELLESDGWYQRKFSADALASLIERAHGAPMQRLRDRVVAEHSLQKLIPKILAVYPS